MSFLHYLSKKISRKNLYKFIINELNKRKDINCLNIGSGGPIEELLKKKVKNYYSIDIDHSRKPNEVIDVCSKDFKVNFNPNLICIFETLEHCQNPIEASSKYSQNFRRRKCMFSVSAIQFSYSR